MASSKHTTQYQLNQWQAGDPVLREDFNSDNLKLENALAAMRTESPKDILPSTGKNIHCPSTTHAIIFTVVRTGSRTRFGKAA